MLLKKIKKYLVGTDSETYAISLVSDPAIEENFLYFKKDEGEKLEIALESNAKHMVYGAVLVPDRPIYRLDDAGEEYYVEFTKESIEKMSQDFFKNFRQFNATVQHEEEVPEVCVVESWLKSDMTADKSVALGLNPELPEGTWFCGFKVNNIDVWERILSGELRGFSVESMISLEELDFSKVEQNNFEETQPQVTEEPVQAPNVAVEEPQTVEEPQQPIETPIEAPSAVVEEPKPIEEPVQAVEPVVEEPKPNPLEDLVNNLKSELDALKEANQSLMDTIKDLRQQPSVKPISTNGGNGGNGDTYSNWRAQMASYLGT